MWTVHRAILGFPPVSLSRRFCKLLFFKKAKRREEFVGCVVYHKFAISLLLVSSFLRCTLHLSLFSFAMPLSSGSLAGRINHQDFTLSLGDLIQRQQRFVLWWQVKRPTHRGANRRSNGPPLHGAARPEIHSALLNKYFQDRLHR